MIIPSVVLVAVTLPVFWSGVLDCSGNTLVVLLPSTALLLDRVVSLTKEDSVELNLLKVFETQVSHQTKKV